MYPGGDYEVFRPSWKRHEVDFGGRKGYVKLAREAGVPIVPIASVGGQEAALFLDRGQWLAKLLMVDKMARLKSVPILLAPPWGLAVSDMVPRLPLPTKIAIEVQDPIDAADIAASDDDVINDKVLSSLQAGGGQARRRTTIPGDRLMSARASMSAVHAMRVDRRRRPRHRLEARQRPGLLSGVHGQPRALGTSTDGPVGNGRATPVHWKIGSVPIGGVIEVVEFDDARDLAWIGITGITQRGRFRLRDGRRRPHKVTFRLAYEAPGGVLGLIADRVAARQVGRTMTETLENLRGSPRPSRQAAVRAQATGNADVRQGRSGPVRASTYYRRPRQGRRRNQAARFGHLLGGGLGAVEVHLHPAAAEHLLAGHHALCLRQIAADRTTESGAQTHPLQDLHGLVVRLADHVQLVGVHRVRSGESRVEQADRARGDRGRPQRR